MADVFDRAVEGSRGFLRDAALAAGHELGLFAELPAQAPGLDAPALARALRVAPRRLRALLDALVLEGVIARDDAAGAGARFVRQEVPPPVAVPREGWGRIAEVLRADRPLPIEGARRYHEHLRAAGAGAAIELFGGFAGARALLDAGGGAGAYTQAFLDGDPARRATLVDLPEILPLAAEALPAAQRERVELVAADLLSAPLPGGHDVALLSNVLHLHSREDCARIVARVAGTLAPGGTLMVKDLRIDPDRRGPPSSVLFALNMAIYTEAGDVHDTDRITEWMRGAGLERPALRTLAAAPDAIVLCARRPPEGA